MLRHLSAWRVLASQMFCDSWRGVGTGVIVHAVIHCTKMTPLLAVVRSAYHMTIKMSHHPTITMNEVLRSCWHMVVQAKQGGFDQYAASVGMARFDHPFWGRPEEMTMKRPVYLVDSGKPSSDLLGGAAAGKQANIHFSVLGGLMQTAGPSSYGYP